MIMQIYVFDRNLNFTGAIDNYSSLRWRRRFNQFSEFELHCPLNSDTLNLLIRGNIVCKSDYTQEAGFIEYRELQQNEQGEEFLVIKGKFLKSYFNQRIIWAQELLNTTYETAMRTLVNDHCIAPTNIVRTVLAGSRNLLLGTATNTAWWNNGFPGANTTRIQGKITVLVASDIGCYAPLHPQLSTNFDANNAHTLSVDLKLSTAPTSGATINLEFRDSAGVHFKDVSISLMSLPLEVWTRVSVSVPLTVGKVLATMYSYIMGIYPVNTTIEYRNLKLELGSKPTDWTPATEDPQGPIDTDRVISNLQLGTLKNYVGNINYQVTYNNLFDELINLSNLSNLGFRILLDTVNKKLNFDVYQGSDRTAGQAINPRCIFSMDFDNILSQNYIDSSNNLKNVALVAGVGVGSARKLVAVGSSAGLDRFEMFVDANNLSNINSVDSSVIADATYLPMLTAKGTADLALTSDIKTFDSKVNTNSNLVYKTDYDLGDKVTCLNKKWGLTMDTVIVEIEEIYEAQGTKINVIFGNNIPTLADKIKIISGQQQGGGASGDSIPAGQVSHFAMASAPSGWLKADGTLISRVTYATLFTAIGIIFGAGDGSTTFNLPDLRGTFVRGVDNGKGLDTGRVFGSYQVDDNKPHQHNVSALVDLMGVDGGYDSDMVSTRVGTHDQGMKTIASNASGLESRPKNVALLACIKF